MFFVALIGIQGHSQTNFRAALYTMETNYFWWGRETCSYAMFANIKAPVSNEESYPRNKDMDYCGLIFISEPKLTQMGSPLLRWFNVIPTQASSVMNRQLDLWYNLYTLIFSVMCLYQFACVQYVIVWFSLTPIFILGFVFALITSPQDLVVSGVGVPVLFLFSMLTVTSIFRPVILVASVINLFLEMFFLHNSEKQIHSNDLCFKLQYSAGTSQCYGHIQYTVW